MVLNQGVREIKLQYNRLAAIDGDDGYTGVKPQHRYVTCSPWHRLSPSFRFFYSDKNYLVQLEDTAIKTERCCSMQCTERTRALHHSIDFYLYFKSKIVFGVIIDNQISPRD